MSASSRDLGGPRDAGGLERRRVRRLARPLALVLAEGRLVDEHVGAARGLDHRSAGPLSPAITTFRPGRAGTEDLVRRDRPAVRERHRLAALERAALRARRYAERVGGLHVEAARPRVLDERVADGRHAVSDRRTCSSR